MSVEFESNADNVKSQMERNIGRCLTMLGLHAQRRVSKETPYDTGHLRASINYRVNKQEQEVVVGSAVSYAIFQELGTRFQPGKAFITPGIMNHTNEYQEICKQTLGEGF